MKKLLTLLVISACFVSCANKQSKDAASVNDSIPPVNHSLEEAETDEEYQEWYDAYFNNYSYEGIKIFEPIAYNDSEYSQQLFNIMDTIVGLFVKDGKYYMKECRIVKTNVFEGKSGKAMIEPTLDTNEKCLYLFRGLKEFNNKDFVDNIPVSGSIMKRGEIKDFTFGDIFYRLSSVVNNYGRDYQLYMTTQSKSQCLAEIKRLKEVLTKLCFIGDLDNDGKADFIIQSPDNNEGYRLLLFLSSCAEKGDLVRLVSILVD